MAPSDLGPSFLLLAVARPMKAQRNKQTKKNQSQSSCVVGPTSGAAAGCTASTILPPWNSISKTRAKEMVGLNDL